MELSFAAPAPGLAGHVSIYYLHRVDYPLIEDVERADVGYLRFLFSGRGSYTYRDGRTAPSHDVMLLGPSTETASLAVNGPLYSFGAVLLPEFWGGIAPAAASDVANFSVDAASVLGPEIQACFEAIKDLGDIEAMARHVDAVLLRMIRPLPDDHLTAIALIGEWLSQYPIPATELLYSRAGFSDRQMMRIANRYFGAPPKMLARKFRALRTASRLIGTRGRIAQALIDEYADQAHMVREVKHFTGLTPRALQVTSNPIMQATLHPDSFRHDAPWK
jgi:AraC-like DNA-binding protein